MEALDKLAGMKAGMKDPRDAVILCDKSGITVSEDLSAVTGAAEAIAGLKKTKPYLFPSSFESQQLCSPPPNVPAPPSKIVYSVEGEGSADPQDRIARGLEKKK